jgi:ATP-dependent Zn protease
MVALWIAGLLLIIVSLLNVNPSNELLIDAQQYRQLLEGGKIDSIRVVDGSPHVKLHKPEKLRDRDRYEDRDRVTVSLGPISPPMIADWRSRGIQVSLEEREENWISVMSDAVPWLLIPGLLSLGIGYIVHEARKSKAGIKTPRERLKALDDRFEAGELSEEEYARQKEEILSEL